MSGSLWGPPVITLITIQFGQIQDFPFITSPTASFPFCVFSSLVTEQGSASLCLIYFSMHCLHLLLSLLHILCGYVAQGGPLTFQGKKEEKKGKKCRDLLLCSLGRNQIPRARTALVSLPATSQYSTIQAHKAISIPNRITN